MRKLGTAFYRNFKSAISAIGVATTILVAGSIPPALAGEKMSRSAGMAVTLSLPITTVKPTERGLYRVSLSNADGKAPLNQMQAWQLTLTDAKGRPVSGATFAIDGGTRDHVHNLPSTPRVTKAIGEGRYLLDGIKFDRQGWWHLTLTIQAPTGRDSVSLPIPVDEAIWAELNDGWSAEERLVLKSLWIGSLPKPAAQPSNTVADQTAAAEFGHRLFFDTRLSRNGAVACASCHLPELAFTDGRKLARGVGQTRRNAPTIVGVAYSPWLFWDGRKDSLWSQAMAPLENPVEHGTSRAQVLRVVRRDADYRRRYEKLFGPLPGPHDSAGIDRAFSNLGKAIAAYERALLPGPSKFDRYVEAILHNKKPAPADQLNLQEVAGLKVFISDNQAQCIRCHNGPMFTDNHFHNIGSQVFGDNQHELGRAEGIKLALADETNCRSKFSDDNGQACAELLFAKKHGSEIVGAFKTPTLRNLGKTAPYMHAGQFQTLEAVIWHYRDVPHATLGESELRPLIMSDAQFRQVEDFLRTLDGPIIAPPHFLRRPDCDIILGCYDPSLSE